MVRIKYMPLTAAALLAAGAAQAAPTVYSDATAFNAATTGVTTNGFENVPTNGSVWILSTGSYSQPGFTITQPTRNAFNTDPGATSYYYNWGTGDVINTPYEAALTVTFTTAVTAFGLDLGVFYGLPFPYPTGVIPGAATTRYGLPVQIGTSQGNFDVATSSSQKLTFFGVTSDTAFNSFTIRGLTPPAQGGASTVFDNLRFGSAAAVTPSVPEPATWAMMIAGFGAVGCAMRRRRKDSTTVRFA